MELFPITLPKQNICQKTELYYRSSQPVQYNEPDGTITMPRKAVLSFDTYFNCFSYSKYLQYTYASVLEMHIKLQGKVQLRLMKAELKGQKVQRTVLLTQQVERESMADVTLLYDFSKETGSGFLYLEITALSKTAMFGGGYYASPILAEQQNHTKLAAVICTYKREDYVKRNLQHLNSSIFAQNSETADYLEVFVIDNGQTLAREQIETAHIKLYPNKNYGGSGGFTRGIIEALKRKSEFSHVLLMDDDILLESSVLIKTIRFLQIVRPEHQDLAIGGSMLRLDDMTVQHEAGAKWTGRLIININKNYNLADMHDLVMNEIDNNPDYNAWWYCCMPLDKIDENNLPLPLFVREDDVEYGIRLFDKWLIMNGIGVWHEPFDKKDNPVMEYYNVRNQMILNAIHFPDNSLKDNLYSVVRFVGKCLLRGKAHLVEVPFRGFDDYAKGIKWLEKQQSDQLHQEIITFTRQLEKKRKPILYYWILSGVLFITKAIQLTKNNKKILRDYQNYSGTITSMDFWTEKLGID